MKKKLLAATALLSCSTLLFTACGSSSKVDKLETTPSVYEQYSSKVSNYSTMTEIEDLKGWESVYRQGLGMYQSGSYTYISSIGLYKKEVTVKINNVDTPRTYWMLYNFETGKKYELADTITDEDDIKYYQVSTTSIDSNVYSVKTYIIVEQTIETIVVGGENTYRYEMLFLSPALEKLATFSRSSAYNGYSGNFSDYFSSTDIYYQGDSYTLLRALKTNVDSDTTKWYLDKDYLKVNFDESGYKFNSDITNALAISKEDKHGTIDESKNELLALDKDGNVLMRYDLPSYAELNDNAVLYLSNGNYIVQYRVPLADDAKKYDVMLPLTIPNGYNNMRVGYAKYNIETKLFDLTKYKVKDLDWDFVIPEIGGVITPNRDEDAKADEGYLFADGIEAVYRGLGEITKDKMVDYNYAVDFAINTEGEILRVESILKDKNVTYNNIEELVTGNFMVTDTLGQEYIVSKEGEIITTINPSAFNFKESNELYNVTVDGEVYDKEYSSVSLGAYKYWGTLDSDLIVSRSRTVNVNGNDIKKYDLYLFNNGVGEPTLIGDSDYVTLYNNFYCVKTPKDAEVTTSKDVYTFYNAKGEKIKEFNYQVTVVYASINEDDYSMVFYGLEETTVDNVVVYVPRYFKIS